MTGFRYGLAGLWLLIMPLLAQAGTIPFSKGRLLRSGLPAHEVVRIAGNPDHRELLDIYWTNRQRWYYIPGKRDRDPWLTVIEFDRWGYVLRVDREKVIRDRY